MGDIVEMSDKELKRVEICSMLADGLITHKEAAARLQLSMRQTKRLLKKYRTNGGKGLISSKRGKSSNREHCAEFKEQIRVLIESDYRDFGPTLAAEKLTENHGIFIGKETLRQYMIEWGLWQPNLKKRRNIHQQRLRREYFGELVQIDGSYHDWFEGRGPKCCLIVFIDDATSVLVGMCFVPTESTHAYFTCIRKYIKSHGRPVAFYNDRHSIFRVNHPNGERGETQFKRAMRELGIEIIYAHSPQAKGRVERANRTLQDRLVKEMRLKNISAIDAANKYVEQFMIKYNKKFGKPAAKKADFHNKNIPNDVVLDAILCERYRRKLSQNLEFSFECTTYQVVAKDAYDLRDTHVDVCRFTNGELKIWHNGNFVECKNFNQKRQAAPIASGKEINEIVDAVVAAEADCKTKKTQSWQQVPFLRLINRSQQNSSAPL